MVTRDPRMGAPVQPATHHRRRNPASQQVAIDRRIPPHLATQFADHAAIVVGRHRLEVIDVQDQVAALLVNPTALQANVRHLAHRRIGPADQELVPRIKDRPRPIPFVKPDAAPAQLRRVIHSDIVALLHQRHACLHPVDTLGFAFALHARPVVNITIDVHAPLLAHQAVRIEHDHLLLVLQHQHIFVVVMPQRSPLTRGFLVRVIALQRRDIDNHLWHRRARQFPAQDVRDVLRLYLQRQRVGQIPTIREHHTQRDNRHRHTVLAQYLLNLQRRLDPRRVIVRPDHAAMPIEQAPVRLIDSLRPALPRRNDPALRHILRCTIGGLLALDDQDRRSRRCCQQVAVIQRASLAEPGCEKLLPVPDDRPDLLARTRRIPPRHRPERRTVSHAVNPHRIRLRAKRLPQRIRDHHRLRHRRDNLCLRRDILSNRQRLQVYLTHGSGPASRRIQQSFPAGCRQTVSWTGQSCRPSRPSRSPSSARC